MRLRALATVLPVLLAAASARAQEYDVVDLGTLGGHVSWAYGINEAGEVTGKSISTLGEWRAFLWSGGSMTDLGALPGSSYSYGFALNDQGQVVGESGYSDAFLWENGQMRALGSLSAFGSSYAHGINDAGEAVGRSLTTSGYEHAFLYQNGTMIDLGTLHMFNWGRSAAYAVNELGQVAGSSWDFWGDEHAFVWQGGVMKDLGTLGGGFSCAYALSDSGLVVGGAYTPWPNYEHAFLYSGGVMIDLGTLKDPDPGGSIAQGVNNLGQVVGWSSYPGTSSVGRHAFLYEAGIMMDLNQLIDPRTGWELEEATGINDAGQIVGYGEYQGNTRAFLLQPATPELTLAPPTPGAAGVFNTLRVTGATPQELVWFVYGPQAGSTPVPGCSGLRLDIRNARPTPPQQADAQGNASFGALVDPSFAGRSLLFQAVERATCRVSNLVAHTFS